MTSGGGGDPVDPDFAALFRPEEVSTPDDDPFEPVIAPDHDHDQPVADADPAPTAVDQEPGGEQPAGDEVAPADDAQSIEATPPEQPEPAAVPMPPVDTGRLFRSQGVDGHDDAVLAVSSVQAFRLRTLGRRGSAPAPDTAAAPASGSTMLDSEPLVVPVVTADAGALHDEAMTPAPRPASGRRIALGRGSITAGAVYVVIIGVTLLVAFANALIAGGTLGWPTGLALLASTVYCALTVRREDDLVAVITPPIAFALAALTAGQLFLGSSAGGLLNRGVVLFFTLADNWPWIIGSTVVALVIVLVRRRRR